MVVSIKGSHRQFKHPSKLGLVTVSGKWSRPSLFPALFCFSYMPAQSTDRAQIERECGFALENAEEISNPNRYM